MNPEKLENKHAKLTRFLCQELLYEYVSGSLKGPRQKDLEEFLPTCRDSQRELENLMKGLQYAKDVAQIQVSPSLHQALLKFEPGWKKSLREWSLWSSQRGWRMLPYAFIGLAIALGLGVTKPWKKAVSPPIELAETAHVPHADPESKAALPQIAPVTTTATPERPTPVSPTGVLAPETPAATTTAAAPPKPEPVAEAKKPVEEFTQPAGTGKGSILRGELTVEEFAAAWPSIRDKVITLGGKAAGNVELGWLRRPTESYFHFSLPESNYRELESFLKTFGPVQIHKERHPRVMPEGQVRIILTVKDGGKDEGAAEAP